MIRSNVTMSSPPIKTHRRGSLLCRFRAGFILQYIAVTSIPHQRATRKPIRLSSFSGNWVAPVMALYDLAELRHEPPRTIR